MEGAWLIDRRDVVNKRQKPFCLVNVSAVLIHHVVGRGPIRRSAFIFGERRTAMVNRFFAQRRATQAQQFRL
ncbi:hypothetical protein LPJ38_10330 [Bradyrhizobium daqingense]|uniref:hypothetical protein n=1 Tax=Bradyrhizobium daqingense TaxID=993502 RepID=UPI0011A96200|nr:hypothetical protein [Bradyrhizobium daqingense]UFS91097.1 hypothetical protein LPJ38_10330 [Bradyrhizobium daqingense]